MSQETETSASPETNAPNEALIADLRAKLAKQETSGRPHEFVKTLVELGDELPAGDEKVELYLKAADLYANKFMNQAEAVRTFEKIREVDSGNPQAIEFLQEMYEKRRDWEKLIALKKDLAESIQEPSERATAFKEIADLATQRVKKPDVCIDLWAIVLQNDPEDYDALKALAQLYERARDYEALANVLEKLWPVAEPSEQVAFLTKLGQVVGDRLRDDARAVEAYKNLLTLDTDAQLQRRAEEQLKKRYVALGRWDELEALYADTGKWDEFIRILESNEARTKDDELRIGMLMKIAELWMTQKGKPDRAARAYEKILSLTEDHLEAAERLIMIYGSINNPKGLSTAIEVKLKHVRDPEERVGLLRQVAELYEGRANNKPLAFERYREAFELMPRDEQAQADLERAAQAARAWDSLIEAYQAAVASATEAGEADTVASLRLKLGRILATELGRVEESLEQYRAALEFEPDNVEALSALEQLYLKSERYTELLEVYKRRKELITDPDERRNVLYQIADLCEAQLGDAAAAISAYREVLEDVPNDSTALEALDGLFLQAEDWHNYADVLRRRIDGDVGQDTLIDLKYRLAQVESKELGNPSVALEHYREILFLEQEHEGARRALEEMLQDADLGAEAANILEGVYEALGDYQALHRVYGVLVKAADSTERRVEVYRKMAIVAATQLGDRKLAFDAQRRALLEDPYNEEARKELELFAGQAELWPAVVELYAKIARKLKKDPQAARDYWWRTAQLQENLGDATAAGASYGQILEIDPGDGRALQALEALYQTDANWEELIVVYRQRIELAQGDAERQNVLAQLARVYEERLGNLDEAVAAYQEVLKLDPTSQTALSALESLYARQERWEDLAENLDIQLAQAASESDELQLLLRSAALREQQMGDAEGAIDIYRQIIDRDPMNQSAISSLERMSREGAHALVIAEILEPLYRQQGEYKKLIEVNETLIKNSGDPHHKVDLLHQVAGLQEDATGDSNAAFDTFARALAFDPSNEVTHDALDRLVRVTGRFQDLARVFEDLASQQQEPELGASLYMLAGRVIQNDLGDVERAIAAYQRALDAEASQLEAVAALEALFQGSERYAELSALLQRKAMALDDLDDQKTALFEAATIEEDVLERPEKAIAVYEKVLELDPEEQRSLDKLVNLFLGMQRWEDLLAVHARKADLVIEPQEKKNIYYQMGAVYESELRDVDKAIDAYQHVLELDPDDLTALGRLDVLYQAAQNWPELLSVLTHEAELTSDADEATSFQYRIGQLYHKHLDDIPRAIELYRDVLGINPNHDAALTALEELKSGPVEAFAAAAVLEPVYEARADYPKLISVLEVQAKLTEDPFAKVDLLHRIARLYEDGMGNLERAFDAFGRSVKVDSQNEDSLGSVERLAVVLDAWPRVAELYGSELEKLTDEPDRAVDLGLRVAQVYEVQLDQAEPAIERYFGVLEVEPSNMTALRALDRLYTRTEQWEDLAGILTREAEAGDTPEDILEFKYRLGETYQINIEDMDRAVATYREVIDAAPEHERAVQALERLFDAGVKQLEIGEILESLYQASGEFEKLGNVYKAQLAHIANSEDRMAMYYRIAELYEERHANPVQAFNAYCDALMENPLDERTGDDIERLADFIENGWELLAHRYADIVADDDREPEQRAAIALRLARVFEDQLSDIEHAEESFRCALQLVDNEPEALSNLDRIYAAQDQYEELAEILEQRWRVAADTQERVELLLRLASVYEESLERPADAIRSLRTIFDELEPSNEEAVAGLARIYEATEAWEELNKVYERQLGNAVGDVEEADIRAKMALLAADRLGDYETAIEGWKRVLELRGEDMEALDALAEIYERQERWAELGQVLERQFDVVETDEERVMALTRRARLSSKALGRDDEALDTWHRVLDIDFSNLMALRAVAEIWRKRDNPEELVRALHALADRLLGSVEESEEVASELVGTYRELAKLYGEVLNQPNEAAEVWTSLLEVDATNLEAMDELEKNYRATDRMADVVTVKMQRANALEDAAEKVRELAEVAEIWKIQLNDFDSAVPALQQILEVESTHDQAFQSLERLHQAAERWEELIELYLNRHDAVEPVADRSELLRRIAGVFEEKLEDNDQAFDALLTAFETDFSDDRTVEQLSRVANASNRWNELIQAANEWLKEEEDKKVQIQLCLRLGKWYGEDLNRQDYAQQYFAKVSQLDPNNAQVLRQMARIYRLRGQFPQAGQTLQRALDVATSNEDRRAVLTDLGDLLEKQMDRTEQAITYYRQALDIDSHYGPAVEALERLYTARGEHVELARVLERKVESLSSDVEIASTELRLGRLYENELNDPQRAAKAYKKAVEADSGNVDALRGLERVYDKLEKWTELAEVLVQQLDVAETERERVSALLKLAHIQEEQFLKYDDAIERYRHALDINPAEVSAYEGLERCFRRLKQWMELVETYEAHIAEVDDDQVRIKLYSEVAKVQADEIGDVDLAINAYENIVDINDTNVEALNALAKLFEKREDPARAIEAMRRVAELTTDGTQKVAMFYGIGKALEERLNNRMEARDSFEAALDLDPAHLQSLAALRAIAIDEGDWEGAAGHLEQEEQHTEGPRAKSKLFVELGNLRNQRLDDRVGAVKAWEAALEQDPETEEAAEPLVQEYIDKERWEAAEPLAELLVRKSGSRDRREQHDLHNRLGQVESALGKHEKALKAYQTAHQLDVTDQRSIRGIADASYELKDWPSALTNYQKVLTSLGEDEVDDRIGVYYRLGCIKREQGQTKQAINNFEKALALGEHRPTLDALVDVYSKAGDWREVAAYKRQILDGAFGEDERFDLLCQIGDVWGSQANEPAKAIEAFEEARELRSTDHVVLHKLLELYQRTSDWQNMVETIRAISGLEEDSKRRARYSYTMAQIYRDKIGDMGRAVELFNEALDQDPEFLEAFERINRVLTKEANWKQLERNYRKMLHRLASKDDKNLEFNLWHQLGLVYRDRIGDAESALAAFKKASHLRPDDNQERTILAELYEVSEQYDEAINETRILLKHDPLAAMQYQNLYRLALHKQSYDDAWCAAAVLAFLRQADEEQGNFYENYRPKGMLPVKGRLTNELWIKYVFHEDQNLHISKIFEMIAEAALKAKVTQLRAQRQLPPLDKRFKQDLATSTVTFAKTFDWSSRVLGVQAPELYIRSDTPGGIRAVVAEPRASVAGQGVLSGFQPHELAFICGRHLASYRGEHSIRTLFQTQSELTVMLFAAVLLAAPNTPMPQDLVASIRAAARELQKHIQPVHYEALRKVVKSFIEEGARANIKTWNQAVDMTAARAGLIVCGDLNIAKKILSQEQAMPGEVPAKDKMKDLLTYFVSDAYSHVRQALGVGIKVDE